MVRGGKKGNWISSCAIKKMAKDKRNSMADITSYFVTNGRFSYGLQEFPPYSILYVQQRKGGSKWYERDDTGARRVVNMQSKNQDIRGWPVTK